MLKRRDSEVSTTGKTRNVISPRWKSVRVTTMHLNDCDLSGNYCDSTLYLSRISLQASLNEASEGRTTRSANK